MSMAPAGVRYVCRVLELQGGREFSNFSARPTGEEMNLASARQRLCYMQSVDWKQSTKPIFRYVKQRVIVTVYNQLAAGIPYKLALHRLRHLGRRS